VHILAAKVISTSNVLVKVKCLELRHSDLQRFDNPPKASVACTLWRSRNLLDEVAAVWIVGLTDRAVRFAHQLWDYVQVAHAAQEFPDYSELPVYIHLLKKGLTQSRGVTLIVRIGTSQSRFTLLTHNLFLEIWTLAIVLSEADFVLPDALVSFVA